MFDEYPDVMSAHDVQKILGIGKSTLYELLSTDRIKHFRIGNVYKIPKVYLIDYIFTDYKEKEEKQQ